MLARSICVAAALALTPLQTWDSRTYTPPGEPGYVYAVVHPAGEGGVTADQPVTLHVQWGAWQHTGRVAPGAGEAAARGVVLRLRHARWDRYPLTVRTTGRIAAGPVQGTPPAQWDQPGYLRVIW